MHASMHGTHRIKFPQLHVFQASYLRTQCSVLNELKFNKVSRLTPCSSIVIKVRVRVRSVNKIFNIQWRQLQTNMMRQYSKWRVLTPIPRTSPASRQRRNELGINLLWFIVFHNMNATFPQTTACR